MEEVEYKSRTAVCSASVVLNTRRDVEYQKVVDKENTWPLGKSNSIYAYSNPQIIRWPKPLDFIWKARDTIKRKRNPLSVFLTNKVSEVIAKFRGQEVN